MFVAATTRCFPGASLSEAAEMLADQDFSSLEVFIHQTDGVIKPSDVLNHFEESVAKSRACNRISTAVYSIDIEPEQDFEAHFRACCRLAKINRVVTLVLRSSPLGAPFNEEMERLQTAVRLAMEYGCVVGVLTEKGRISGDLQTTLGFCNRINGLMCALDPSYYLGEAMQSKIFDQLLPFVSHVRIRDSKPGEYQCKVGQGELEFGKLVSQLEQVGYNRGLSVDIVPRDGDIHLVELRKMRLLMESLMI